MPTSSCVLPLPKRVEEKLMGITHVTVRIVNPADSQRYRNVDFLVDSAAIYTFIPKNILQDIGINPHSRRSFVMANGEKFVRRIGSAHYLQKAARGHHCGFLRKRRFSVTGGYGLGGCRVDSRSSAAETQTRRSDRLSSGIRCLSPIQVIRRQ